MSQLIYRNLKNHTINSYLEICHRHVDIEQAIEYDKCAY
jgi:hypothetical protein